jgi:serine/threonine-protein kinase
MAQTADANCPSCGNPLPRPAGGEPTLRCASCSASLAPDAASRLTLVTRSGPAGGPRIGHLTLSPSLCAEYDVGRLLGSGTMGAVFSAVQRSTDKPVALKFLLRMDQDWLARFLREGKLLARITHPNVLRVIDVGDVDGFPYLVTELAMGGSLRHRLDMDGRLPHTRVAALAASLATGLEACHAAAVVHRDLKPANVLFDAEDRPRIADFGIARSLVQGEVMTESGAIIGTPKYMSPEQVRGERVGPPADVYALGCTLYEALAGTPPFDHAANSKLFRAHLDEDPPPLMSLVERVPTAFAALVMSMLEKDPAARPTTAVILLSIRDPASGLHPRRRLPASKTTIPVQLPGRGEPAPSSPPVPSSPPAPARALRRPWVAALLIASAILVALETWLAVQ